MKVWLMKRRRLFWYLCFPRPGPFFSIGKILFFLLGSTIGIACASTAPTLRRWALAFTLYELVISQGKYLFNDFMGRKSDQHFLRVHTNFFPEGGITRSLTLIYAVGRSVGGVVGLYFTVGMSAAALGMLTVLLQILYEFIKIRKGAYRGEWAFVVVSISYGVRALAGLVAIEDRLLPTLLAILLFSWASGLAALFLLAYWYREGDYYVRTISIDVDVLSRYKPGVIKFYNKQLNEKRTGQLPLRNILLTVSVINSLLFLLLNPGSVRKVVGVLMIAYVGFSLVILITVSKTLMAANRTRKQLLIAALAAIALAGICHGLITHTAMLLPFSLCVIATGSHLLLFNIPEERILGIRGNRIMKCVTAQ